jgi:hypothetical protein
VSRATGTDLNRRSNADRRSGKDRRKVFFVIKNGVAYPASRGLERRRGIERRSREERRETWVREGRWRSVLMEERE